MKKMIYRVLSYGIDMLIVSLITLGICVIPFVNPNYGSYKEKYNELNNIRNSYSEFAKKTEEALEDKKITTEEYNGLNDYKVVIAEDKLDKDLNEDEVGKIKDDASNKYVDSYNELAYSLTKDNYITKVVTIGISILYLGIIQFFLKGKTIGKFFFKIKVVDKDDINKEVPLWKYLVRSILVGEVLLIGADLVALFATNKDMYLNASNIINTVQYIYEIIFLIVMMMREDGRSIHDLLLNTRVALFDKAGKEVIEEKKEEVVEEVKKEEKKATPKKKTTTKKKTSKKKEFVSAEKVDD